MEKDQAGQAVFELNGTTLAAIGGILVSLAGAITFLMRQLLSSKDSQIEHLQAQLDQQRDELGSDRDYWRNTAMRLLEPAERAIKLAEGRERQLADVGLPVKSASEIDRRLAALEATVDVQSRPPRSRRQE